MNKTVGFIASALTAGACIGVAAMVYLRLGGLVGSIMFAFGLITVVYFGLDLYTGRSQFVWGRSGTMSYGKLLAMLVLNIIGCAAVSLLADNSAFVVDQDSIVSKRLTDGIFMSALRAIPCGFIMTLAVRAARGGLWLPLLFGVPTFIICGFPHCIADVFYYSTCTSTLITDNPGYFVTVYLGTVVGNYIGCNIYRTLPEKK